MDKIGILSFLCCLSAVGLIFYTWQTAGTEEKINWKKLILPVTMAVFGILECSGVIRDEEHWEFLKPRHQIDISWEAITKIYKQPSFWYLKNSHIIDPFIYRHPKGAVIWVKDVERLRIENVGPVYGRL